MVMKAKLIVRVPYPKRKKATTSMMMLRVTRPQTYIAILRLGCTCFDEPVYIVSFASLQVWRGKHNIASDSLEAYFFG